MRDFPLALDLGAYRGALGCARGGAAAGRRDDLCRKRAEARRPLPAPGLGLRRGFAAVQGRSLNLVVSGLALHRVNDLPGALIQIRRALAPDGLFLGAALGSRSLHELREALLEAEAEETGGASPHIAPFADLRDYGALLQRAGFALPVTDAELLTLIYPIARAS